MCFLCINAQGSNQGDLVMDCFAGSASTAVAAFNKKLADTFAFRSDFSTKVCMGILGKRRMGNLIRCKRIFP